MNKKRPIKFVPVKDSSVFSEHFNVVMFDVVAKSNSIKARYYTSNFMHLMSVPLVHEFNTDI